MLSLRPMDPKGSRDRRFVHSVRSNPEVYKWLHGPPLPLPQADAMLRNEVGHKKWSIFILELEEDPIGYAQFVLRDGVLELGWAIDPAHQGKGLGREAVWAWLAYCGWLPQMRLELAVKEENERAIKLYEEIGFQRCGAGSETGLHYDRMNDLQSARLIYVGHAGFQIEHDGVRLLCDPWFNSAFYDSWRPHPGNAHVRDHLIPPTHVFVSHAHEDHFDRAFLNTLSRQTEIVCPHWLDREFWKMGFTMIHPLVDGETVSLHDCGGQEMKVTLFTDERKRDSALLIETNGKRILNLNDCHLPLEKLPRADVLLSHFSGAFHYPHCYDFEPAVMHDKIHDVKIGYVDKLIKTAGVVRPEIYIPSSGPPWLSDPKLNRSDSIFYRWDQELVGERFQECQAAQMQPGDELLIGDRLAWVKRPKWFLAHLLKQEIEGSIASYFQRLSFKHRRLLEHRPKSFYLDWGSGLRLVYMNGLEAVVFDAKQVSDKPRANYTLRIRPEMMFDILKGGRWDAALLSNKIRLHRDRDVYDAELFQILYNDRPEDPELALEENPEMVDRGDGISHQRFCPHQGADLSFAPMEVDLDGKRVLLKCPRHGWKWDIKTGKCISGGEQPISVKGSPP